MIRLIGSTLALLLALAQTAWAQDDRWQVTLDDERYVWDIRHVRLDGDSLVVRQSDSLVSVPVAHINEIRLIRKSEVHVGAGGAQLLHCLSHRDALDADRQGFHRLDLRSPCRK